MSILEDQFEGRSAPAVPPKTARGGAPAFFSAWDLHFKNLCHGGVIIIPKPREGSDFRDIHFSLCREKVIIDMDMHHFTIDDFDPAVVGIAPQTMSGKIATFKMRGALRHSGTWSVNTRYWRHSGTLKLID